MSAPIRVEFVIDRLVVHGVDRARARTVQRDLETRLEELSRRWIDAAAPFPVAGYGTAAARLTVPAAGPGRRLGIDVAEALVTAISTPPSRHAPPGRTSTGRGSAP